MSNVDIVRAWKDSAYRASLTEEQRAQLPQNPAGFVQLSGFELERAADDHALYTTLTGTCCTYCTASPTGYA
ncbi:MAG: mersacidin/lichenicidin family type 2 lantibiotic [Chloroflexi bacterium AL-W]|nr:mersacidin/lichenicidin family type 2 lantibiotic [Chloroflexi bacterium AL-N1]NOK66782.1 mersacidin/lichenicidin family type 2 lantibiotic [Chloroflexi bacterium AL-N10]NOK74926.1 mersacidin/lichenicidin family type 2 lantibiotic [Chloroflexi bacterium AL-N5]NOK81385.1 mersacidin/lichenicidin family type 2 lantibiotic [Chloroflexi bacterium AL-W]NOK88854.1 mersacidin/lichenicidin family type 2 lantibiotic [Chloroflexi bacterium AL-N15]